jgi:hypothetical protein
MLVRCVLFRSGFRALFGLRYGFDGLIRILLPRWKPRAAGDRTRLGTIRTADEKGLVFARYGFTLKIVPQPLPLQPVPPPV